MNHVLQFLPLSFLNESQAYSDNEPLEFVYVCVTRRKLI